MTSSKKRIVAVDDQEDNRLILQEMLEPTYEVHLLSGGQKMLDYALEDHPIDLILLDVVMPGIDGFEVCKKLKAMPMTKSIPVVFLTGLDSQADEEYGLLLGAVDFIHKPFSESVMMARIRNHL